MTTDNALDDLKVLCSASHALHGARSQEELDTVWTENVRPHYDDISENILSLLHKLYALKQSDIMKGR